MKLESTSIHVEVKRYFDSITSLILHDTKISYHQMWLICTYSTCMMNSSIQHHFMGVLRKVLLQFSVIFCSFVFTHQHTQIKEKSTHFPVSNLIVVEYSISYIISMYVNSISIKIQMKISRFFFLLSHSHRPHFAFFRTLTRKAKSEPISSGNESSKPFNCWNNKWWWWLWT